MREMFSKSIAPTRPLSQGDVLTREMLTSKKPGGGIRPDEIEKLLGRTVRHDIPADRLLRWEDLE